MEGEAYMRAALLLLLLLLAAEQRDLRKQWQSSHHGIFRPPMLATPCIRLFVALMGAWKK